MVVVAGNLGFLANAAASTASAGDVPAPLVFLVGVRDFLANNNLVLDNNPSVERFIPVEEAAFLFFGDVQKDPPGHSDLVTGVNQGIVFVVGSLDEAAIKAIPRVVCTDLGLADDNVVKSRALDQHGLLGLVFTAGGPAVGGF